MAKKKMAKKKFYNGAMMDDRMQDRDTIRGRDSRMLDIDRNAPYNMPQEVVMQSWQKKGPYIDWRIQDNMMGMDARFNDDVRVTMGQLKPNKQG